MVTSRKTLINKMAGGESTTPTGLRPTDRIPPNGRPVRPFLYVIYPPYSFSVPKSLFSVSLAPLLAIFEDSPSLPIASI